MAVAAIGAGLSGHVRIGIVPTAAQFLLPAVAWQLLQEAPQVTLRTVVGLMEGATMHRRLVVTYRAHGFVSPAARRLVDLFEPSVLRE